jgi:hypothetical protein
LLLNPKAGHEHKDGRLVPFLKATPAAATPCASASDFRSRARPRPGGCRGVLLYPKMSKDFLPAFREETALVAATAAPGTSLEEMNKISDVIEQQILAVPEVRKVGRRLGRAERGDHVVPVSTAEFDVDFREPRSGHEGPRPQPIRKSSPTSPPSSKPCPAFSPW